MLVRRVVLNSACNCLGRRSLASEGRRLADRLLFFGKYKYMHFLAGIFFFKHCLPRFSWLLAEEQQNGDHYLLFLIFCT